MACSTDKFAATYVVAPDLGPPILGIPVGDALDQSGQHLAIGWRGFALHDGRHTLAVLSARICN